MMEGDNMNMNMNMNTSKIGIEAIEVYFPSLYVKESELEIMDKVGEGKYTEGLGQHEMGCPCPNEDITSICYTVLQNLISKHNIDIKRIGRLEIGTETLIDKSKSIKTELMNILKGNMDVEGATVLNACYGGTAALFNTVDWLSGSAAQGKLGVVICADIAIYPKGIARPTGGVGAVAMLLSTHAPLIITPIRSTCARGEYDFYKPDPCIIYIYIHTHIYIYMYIYIYL